MVITETIIINEKEFVRNYSSLGYFIERDGMKFAEAIDPVGSDRVYVEVETDKEATEEDYLAALAKLGVEV